MDDKSKYSPELAALCWDLYLRKQMSLSEISQYLYEHEGVTSSLDHTRPTGRQAVYTWINLADRSATHG